MQKPVIVHCLLMLMAALPVAAVANPWSGTSSAGHFQVNAAPLASAAPIGRFHTWELNIRNRQGEPVRGAAVQVRGHMPAHGHGMPSQPQVTGEISAGRYRVQGMRFNMHGDWELLIQVRTGAGTDVIRLPIQLAY